MRDLDALKTLRPKSSAQVSAATHVERVTVPRGGDEEVARHWKYSHGEPCAPFDHEVAKDANVDHSGNQMGSVVPARPLAENRKASGSQSRPLRSFVVHPQKINLAAELAVASRTARRIRSTVSEDTWPLGCHASNLRPRALSRSRSGIWPSSATPACSAISLQRKPASAASGGRSTRTRHCASGRVKLENRRASEDNPIGQ